MQLKNYLEVKLECMSVEKFSGCDTHFSKKEEKCYMYLFIRDYLYYCIKSFLSFIFTCKWRESAYGREETWKCSFLAYYNIVAEITFVDLNQRQN